MSAAQRTCERQSYILDLCLDTYSLIEEARRRLSDTVMELYRRSRSREASPDTIAEILNDVINLPVNCLEQATFLTESNLRLDISPLLAEVGLLQEECRLVAKDITNRKVKGENNEESLDISTLQSTCRLLRLWLERRMHNLRQVRNAYKACNLMPVATTLKVSCTYNFNRKKVMFFGVPIVECAQKFCRILRANDRSSRSNSIN